MAALLWAAALENGYALPESSKDDVVALVAAARDHGLYYMLVYDEIQHLYIPASSADAAARELGGMIVSQFYQLGKNACGIFTVLTGSSQRVRAYAHHERLTELGVPELAHTYSNLNHTVYLAYPVLPLRTRDEMRAARPDDTDEVRANRFFRSDGIGRYLDRSAESAKLLEKLVQQSMVLRLLLAAELVTVDACNGTVSINDKAAQEYERDPWRFSGLSKSELLLMLQTAQSSGNEDERYGAAVWLLLLAEESGYVYNDGADITFLLPCWALQLVKELQRLSDVAHDRTAMCFQLLFGGLEGGSLGAYLQKVVLQEAVHTMALAGKGGAPLKASLRKLSFAKGRIKLGDEYVTELPLYELIAMKVDKGEDGFWLEEVEGVYGG